MKFTSVFWKNCRSKVRVVINQGGTSSSKTYSILQLLIVIAQNKPGVLISVVAETLPQLKRGAIKDFLSIMTNANLYHDNLWNKSDYTFKFHNGSQIEFFSADNGAKVRGARRDYLFINECNNVPYHVYDQLEVRTKVRCYLDFNPVSSFWVHEKVMPVAQYEFIKSTYKDNEHLDERIVKAIEARQVDAAWWRVYGLGEVGVIDGIVFPELKIVPEFPEQCKWVAYGLDFGFTNDPSSLIKVGFKSGELFQHQLIYERGLTNSDLSKRFREANLQRGEIIADSAEPKSIEELRRMGWNVKGAYKGKDSVNNGIDLLKRYPMNITASSVDLIDEYRNYTWKKDRATERWLNEPVDKFNHGIDAVRYVAIDKLRADGGKSRFHFTLNSR